MSSPESASAVNDTPCVRDRALWKAALQLMAGHPRSSIDESRCANPRCDPGVGHPCTPARTATRLAVASQLPFHQRMTALSDARTCVVLPPHFGLAAASVEADGGRVISVGEPASLRADAPAPGSALMSAVGA